MFPPSLPHLVLAEWLAGKWWVLLVLDVSMGFHKSDEGRVEIAFRFRPRAEPFPPGRLAHPTPHKVRKVNLQIQDGGMQGSTGESEACERKGCLSGEIGLIQVCV